LPRLVVVSNRVAAPDPSGKGVAGGLAVAVREAFQTQGGLWFGWSGKVTAEPDAHPKIIDKQCVQYALMDLRPIDRQEYYNGFANRALWPTMHYRSGLSEFSRADLAGYLRVNRTFANALARLLQPDDLVWVHDYHLIPLAAELRALGATNPIGYFHHIPWPAPEVFGTLPGSRELLRAVADYDLVGVQIEQDADNLRRGLVQELGAVQRSADLLAVGGRRIRVKSFPIGIDVKGFRQAAERVGPNRIVEQVLTSLGTRKLIIGVDRLDYSKGIPERMQAFERFLVSNPDQRGLITFLQIAPKTRGDVPEYATLSRAVNQTLGRINGGLGEPGWVPIHYVTSTYPRPVLARLCRLARIGLVTPMRDGMNLVAKEYIAAQDAADPGVLILSKFAGAAQQLTDALIVNPSDKFEVAQAIREGLHMSRDERVSRWEVMFRRLGEQDVTWWAATYVRDLAASKLTNSTHRPRRMSRCT
jgi:trehalose 6-phosphate synthase